MLNVAVSPWMVYSVDVGQVRPGNIGIATPLSLPCVFSESKKMHANLKIVWVHFSPGSFQNSIHVACKEHLSKTGFDHSPVLALLKPLTVVLYRP